MNRYCAAVLILVIFASVLCISQQPSSQQPKKEKQASPLNPNTPPDTPEGLINYLLPDDSASPEHLSQISRETAIKVLTGAQTDAKGIKADGIAYLLVLLGHEADANRERLLASLRACARDPEPCDDRLISYLGNLFQRGDALVLDPLLEFSKVTDTNLSEVLSSTYQDMLAHDTPGVITAISRRPNQDQRHICRMIAAGDGSGLPVDTSTELMPKLEALARTVGPIANTAMLCTNEIRAFVPR